MPRTVRIALLGLACAWLAGSPAPVAAAEDLPPFGPPLGVKADVVRSFSMKTTGGMALAVTGAKGDGKTGLLGQCKPTLWANFGVEVGRTFDTEKSGITVVTKDKIATGATGPFQLTRLDVERLELKGASLLSSRYTGPGVLVITTHDGTPGRRRMVGTISGKGLKGRDDAEGKTIDVEASFDMDFSCGVK
jgi:hypothetical protein